MYRFVVMHCGYVENSNTSALIYQCMFFGRSGYLSMKEAITDLALDMYAKFYDERLSIYENRYSKDVKKCCRESLIANQNAKFCSECGSQIVDKQFASEEFKDFVTNLHCSTCDSYGEAEGTATREFAWWPYWTSDFIGAPKEDIIYIAENAEVILLAALLEAKPELQIDDFAIDYVDSEWEQFKSGTQPTYR